MSEFLGVGHPGVAQQVTCGLGCPLRLLSRGWLVLWLLASEGWRPARDLSSMPCGPLCWTAHSLAERARAEAEEHPGEGHQVVADSLTISVHWKWAGGSSHTQKQGITHGCDKQKVATTWGRLEASSHPGSSLSTIRALDLAINNGNERLWCERQK